MSKNLKQELKEELERVEYHLRTQMEWFRSEIKPLKTKQQDLLERISQL